MCVRVPHSNPMLRFDFRPDNVDDPQSPLVFRDPLEVVTACQLEDVLPALARVEAATDEGRWAAGFVAYEAAPAFDSALRAKGTPSVPLLWFGLFERPQGAADSVRESGTTSSDPSGFHLGEWEADVEPSEYHRAIGLIREAIGAGDTYQVNYTLRMAASFQGDALALYHRLCAAQGPAYSAYLDIGRTRVLSTSPELFFRRRGDQITCRPMKGTARRGRWAEEDAAARSELLASEKERAENAMIVDLIRNDLGRISEYGSVRASNVFEVEPYRTVLQMTSTVEGTAREGTSLTDLFQALFPCGSVTGAPKISTTGFIADLEREPRGVYCGAIGYVAPHGDCVFNVPIRTAVVDLDREVAEYGVGGGITWDSRPDGEYAEMLAKAEILRVEWPEFSLLETLGADSGGPVRLAGHVARMKASAEYFGFQFDSTAVRRAIVDGLEEAEVAGEGPWCVRALSDVYGCVTVEVRRLEDAGPTPSFPRAGFASAPVASTDVFLFHKTTHRSVYESRAAEHPECFDVLLVNEDGYLTEFTRGNLVAEIDGVAWTPPRHCGLLGGVFRAELLSQGRLQERCLTPADVRHASRVWLINSVREWVEIEVV